MIKKVILASIVVIIGLFLIIIVLNFINITDFLVAKTIPQYPNNINWKISSSNGFPDGLPGADITFETDDTPEEIIDYYKDELTKRKWEPIEGYKDIHHIEGSGFTNVGQKFKKNILGIDFYLTISKGQTTRADYQQFTKRAIIFVDRYQ